MFKCHPDGDYVGLGDGILCEFCNLEATKCNGQLHICDQCLDEVATEIEGQKGTKERSEYEAAWEPVVNEQD